jgi:hypothetical protein
MVKKDIKSFNLKAYQNAPKLAAWFKNNHLATLTYIR